MRIDIQYRGRVIASMDSGRYLPGHESWAYLEVGIMVDTDFGGLVYYTTETAEEFELIQHDAPDDWRDRIAVV
jgi:hypothetical protein